MVNQPPEIIAKYEVLFAARTGITILMPKSAAFDCGLEAAISFRVSPDSPRDLLIDAAGRRLVLPGLQKDYLDEALTRGFIMFYEMKDDEVVRCTPAKRASL